jgi:hypothetical protein
MALPAGSVRQVRAVEQIVTRVDQAFAAHIVTGAALPDLNRVRRELVAAITIGVTVAVAENTESETVSDGQVAAIVAAIMVGLGRQLRTTKRVRARIVAELPLTAAAIASPSPIQKLAARLAEALDTRRDVRLILRRAAAATGVPVPGNNAARARMIARTEIAIARNRIAARLAQRDEQLLWVTDGGPCSYECETFDRKWATPRWVLANPVAHPNCVRQTQPREAPAGTRPDLR